MRHFVYLAIVLSTAGAWAQGSFVNFETPQYHPLDISPNGQVLAVCNTADARAELYDLSSGTPAKRDSLAVGLDPASLRFRTDTELWVVNTISDSVSIVDLTGKGIRATLQTDDEPSDVVFAGDPQRAYVSCSQSNTILVFDPADLAAAPHRIAVDAEDPRALAVSRDGKQVYAAIFNSGNRSTTLAGGVDESRFFNGQIAIPPNIVDKQGTPHHGQNPPFNATDDFTPPKNPLNGDPPLVGLIVKQRADNTWYDDANGDWTAFVSGDQAARSGRPIGWTVLDHDIAVIDTATNNLSYVDHLMNICMGIAVNPATGAVNVIGTDATNEVRFEPNVNGVFLRVLLATADPAAPASPVITDLNPHLTYTTRTVDFAERQKSIGDPRAIVWNAAGTRAYVAGMGSNNLAVLDATGARDAARPVIPVREGPTGLALDEDRGQLYVLNRFHGSLSVVSLASETEIANIPLHDPTPAAIKTGRKHLYDTQRNSGLGQVSCGSCHVDARTDRIAWDLGNPAGDIKSLDNLNLGGNIPNLDGTGNSRAFDPFHPMKGPMTTQTMQDIIGHEPFHWRGDRLGLDEFNPAFPNLLGADSELNDNEMLEFKNYLATIYFPPNPYRNLDNTLPTKLPLPGHYASGRFLPRGTQMPDGNARAGVTIFRDVTRKIDQNVASCNMCHTFPAGSGTGSQWNGSTMAAIPRGPKDENHLMLVSIDGSTQSSIKVPQLRSVYEKVGCDFTHTQSRSGFGFLHDGSIDSVVQFLSEQAFNFADDQEVADVVALMMCWSGSDFPASILPGSFLDPPGTFSKDVHAGVGRQVTLDGSDGPVATFDNYVAIVQASPRVELMAHQRSGNFDHGWLYTGNGVWQCDRASRTITTPALLMTASPAAPITVTIVVAGTGRRLALDCDEDDYFNYDEKLGGSDPFNKSSIPVGEGEGEGEGSAEGEGEGSAEGEGEGEGGGEGEGEGEGEPIQYQTSDQDHDGVITLSELLRVIQFYNAGGYHYCPGQNTEDGFCTSA